MGSKGAFIREGANTRTLGCTTRGGLNECESFSFFLQDCYDLSHKRWASSESKLEMNAGFINTGYAV